MLDNNNNYIIIKTEKFVANSTNGSMSYEYASTSYQQKNATMTTVQSDTIPYTVTIDEAVDRIGHGKFQNQILFAAGLCFMADSMEIMLLSFLTLVLKNEWGWEGDHPIEIPIITAVMFAGALFGTNILGPLGDKVGRKKTLFSAAFIISSFGLVTALCNSFLPLAIVRFMVGFGIGGLTVPFDILAEFLPTENRGKYLLYIEYFWTAGSMLVPVVAYITFQVIYSWRLFVVLCSIPCLLSLFASIKYVPESPRWLIMKGRNKEALQILRDAARVNGINPSLVFPDGCNIECEEEENSNLRDLFTPRWRKITILLWIVWFGFAFSYYGTIMVVTRLFGNGEDDHNAERISFDYGAIFVTSVAELFGTIIVIEFVDKIGRIRTQMISYSLGGFGLLFLCIFSSFGSSKIVLVILAFMVRICEMAGSCTTWISTAEILSTEIRSTGHSAANAVARIGGFLSPFLIAGDISLINIGVLMFLVHGITAFCVTNLPETTGMKLGKATEDTGTDQLWESTSSSNIESMELI